MQEFQIAPASLKTLWIITPVVVVPMLIVVIALGTSFLGMKNARFQVSSEGLRLRGDFYGRTIPASELRVDEARRVDIARGSDYRPVRRTLGTGLPGYRAGWFRLSNGEKALLYVTDPSRVVYIPTRAGYSVMLSPRDPDRLLSAIQAVTNK